MRWTQHKEEGNFFYAYGELSPNDLGLTGSHQKGILIPKGIARDKIFGKLDSNANYSSTDITIQVPTSQSGSITLSKDHELSYLYYESKKEYRITSGSNVGAIDKLLQSLSVSPGDVLKFTKDLSNKNSIIEISKAEPIKTKSWLLYFTESPTLIQASPYEDDISSAYQWDTTVPNWKKPQKGDVIIIWDGQNGFGFSVIQEIIEKKGIKKKRLRCPYCTSTKMNQRKTTPLPFRCQDCNKEFNNPKAEIIKVNQLISEHSAGWQDFETPVSGEELRSICFKPKSQQSIREIDTSAFQSLLKSKGLSLALELTSDLQEKIAGGHKWVKTRTRIGQQTFRNSLLKTYGSNCAITGPSPAEVLQACHLERFSETGRHDGGGLLLRSDLHSLLDRGLLRINPDSSEITISKEISKFPQYKDLNNKKIKVSLNKTQKKSLKIHFEQHSKKFL